MACGMTRLCALPWHGAWRASTMPRPVARYAFVPHNTSCIIGMPWHGHGEPLVFNGMRLDTPLCPAMERGKGRHCNIGAPSTHAFVAHGGSCLIAMPWRGHGVPLVFNGFCHDTPYFPAMARGMARINHARAPVTTCLCRTWHVMRYYQAMARHGVPLVFDGMWQDMP